MGLNKLKPCPFYGEDSEHNLHEMNLGSGAFIWCKTCTAFGPELKKGYSWNTRHKEERVQENVKKCVHIW